MRLKQKYGVEIETILSYSQADEIARRITEAGVDCRMESYNHTRRRHWKFVPDSTCGMELVSPPMWDEKQLKVVCEVLADYETEHPGIVMVNRSCGLHVHHDARNWNADQGKALIKNYTAIESQIDKIMPRSRRGNRNNYCRSMRSRNIYTNGDSMQWLAEAYPSRYLKVNLQSWLTHGTVEFRQHSGTVNFDKIWNWVILTSGIVGRSKNLETVNRFCSFVVAIHWALGGAKTPSRLSNLVVKYRQGWTVKRAVNCAPLLNLSVSSIRRTYRFLNEQVAWDQIKLPVDCQRIEFFIRRAQGFGFRVALTTAA